MKFLNFKDYDDKKCITPTQLTLLLDLEEQASEKKEQIYVSLMHRNFDNSGTSRLIVIIPSDYVSKENQRTYKYQAFYLDGNDVANSLSGICGMYANLDIALFEADLLAGVETSEQLQKKKPELNARIDNIHKALQEKERNV